MDSIRDRAKAIARHRTAIIRRTLSRPVAQAIADNVLSPEKAFFDFGCGHGIDLRILQEAGYQASGWDPKYAPGTPRANADVVNVGYVINVIENIDERRQVLVDAFSLARRCMVVSAQLLHSGRTSNGYQFEDGVVTRRQTFQKYYSQQELRDFIEQTLSLEAIPATLGVFYVFRDEADRQDFILRKVSRRRIAGPRKTISLEEQLAPHRELLESFAYAVESLGRVPRDSEFSQLQQLQASIGSPRRCVALCRRLFEGFSFEQAQKQRAEDLRVYIALSRFRKRPRFGLLPSALQWDIRDLFGSYSNACELADELLFKAGDPEVISSACAESKVGKLLPDDLYVHATLVDQLPSILRVYLGCGRALLGEVQDANIVKIHRFSGKISYLAYPDFDTQAHPTLYRSVLVNLRTQEIIERDYSNSENPPILHRKETFVDPHYPGFEKFSRLTQQEVKVGLLDEKRRIGTMKEWGHQLEQMGYFVAGHRLCRRRSSNTSEGLSTKKR